MGLLRPHEARDLRIGDFLTPSRLLSVDLVMFVTLHAPNMRRITAKRTYARVDQRGFVDFADAYVNTQLPSSPVFHCTYAHFRQTFRVIAAELGIPIKGPLALSWGSCHPGGATWLLRATDNPEVV